MKKLNLKYFKGFETSGFSLMGVLLSMFIMGFVAFIASQTVVDSTKAQKRLELTQEIDASHLEAMQAAQNPKFIDSIRTQLGAAAPGMLACFDGVGTNCDTSWATGNGELGVPLSPYVDDLSASINQTYNQGRAQDGSSCSKGDEGCLTRSFEGVPECSSSTRCESLRIHVATGYSSEKFRFKERISGVRLSLNKTIGAAAFDSSCVSSSGSEATGWDPVDQKLKCEALSVSLCGAGTIGDSGPMACVDKSTAEVCGAGSGHDAAEPGAFSVASKCRGLATIDWINPLTDPIVGAGAAVPPWTDAPPVCARVRKQRTVDCSVFPSFPGCTGSSSGTVVEYGQEEVDDILLANNPDACGWQTPQTLGACDVACGGGTQSVTFAVACQGTINGVVTTLDDKYCQDFSPKPPVPVATTQACNVQACCTPSPSTLGYDPGGLQPGECGNCNSFCQSAYMMNGAANNYAATCCGRGIHFVSGHKDGTWCSKKNNIKSCFCNYACN